MASVRETILFLVLAGYLEASVKKPSFVSMCVDWFLSHFQVGQISLAISLQGSQCILSSFWFPPPVPLHIYTQCTHESCIVLFPQQSRHCCSQSQPNDTSRKACFPDLRKKKKRMMNPLPFLLLPVWNMDVRPGSTAAILWPRGLKSLKSWAEDSRANDRRSLGMWWLI